MVDAVVVTLFSYAPMRTRAGLVRVLDTLEGNPVFTPTRWGRDERAKLPYRRDDLLNEVAGFEGDLYMPGIRRSGKPAYSGYFTTKNQGLNYFRLDFSNLAERFLQGVFELGDALSEQLKPEFGFVHPVWYEQSSQEYGAAGAIDLTCFENYGPSSVCARTWFGKSLVKLIGRDVLRDTGAAVTATAWGGARLDLVDNPWNSSVQELMDLQTKAMNSLGRTGVFGDYSDLVDYKRGARFSLPFDPIV